MELSHLTEAVKETAGKGTAVTIRGGGTKGWLGRQAGRPNMALDVSAYQGVLDYRPEELMIRVKAGTRLQELNGLLAQAGQFLPFEPPLSGEAATIGGAVAAGLSGARRPYAGALRDYVLGTGLISANGEYREFGGQVMKNVAGYDVSRLLAGSLGILGVIADISIKVLPLPEAELTLTLERDAATSIDLFRSMKRQGLPVSAACWLGGQAYLRLSGNADRVRLVAKQLKSAQGAGEDDPSLWARLDGRQHGLFAGQGDCLAFSCEAGEALRQGYDWIAWGGAQRWLCTDAPSLAEDCGLAWVRHAASATDTGEVFSPLPAALMQIHSALKSTFDPGRVFNPGRMYQEL